MGFLTLVAAGFGGIKFQNNRITMKHSRRSNTEVYVILTAILKNVIHSV